MLRSSLLRKESIFPVCDKHYHTNKSKVQKGEKIEFLRTCEFSACYGKIYDNLICWQIVLNCGLNQGSNIHYNVCRMVS